MRIGLTDMIVTDLSQSVDIEVLGTDRLVQILQQLKRADDRVISADVVQEIARRANVDQVVVGSYVAPAARSGSAPGFRTPAPAASSAPNAWRARASRACFPSSTS